MTHGTDGPVVAGDPIEARILQRAQAPPNRGRLPDATHHAQGDNPLCGDRLEVWARVDADGRIADARFDGDACTIALAGASLLLDHARGRRPDEVARMGRETVLGLLGIHVTTTRVKCAVLGLATLKDAVRAPDDAA